MEGFLKCDVQVLAWQQRTLCFLAKSHLRNETLAFVDALGKFQGYAACGFKSIAPSCQKMKVEKSEYISNYLYENVVIFQDVLKQRCYVKSL